MNELASCQIPLLAASPNGLQAIKADAVESAVLSSLLVSELQAPIVEGLEISTFGHSYSVGLHIRELVVAGSRQGEGYQRTADKLGASKEPSLIAAIVDSLSSRGEGTTARKTRRAVQKYELISYFERETRSRLDSPLLDPWVR